MTKYLLLSILSALIILQGCSKDRELQESVFIEDTEFSGLPIYSEWGYNTFGAYYDRFTAFVSNKTDIPLKIVVKDSASSFLFKGKRVSLNEYNYYGNESKMSIEIIIKGLVPEYYENLVVLNDSILDLSSPDCSISLTVDDSTYILDVLSGTLEFTKAQNLFVDGKQTEIILSGYFEFQTLFDGEPVSFSDGRFDIGISQDSFFVLDK